MFSPIYGNSNYTMATVIRNVLQEVHLYDVLEVHVEKIMILISTATGVTCIHNVPTKIVGDLCVIQYFSSP